MIDFRDYVSFDIPLRLSDRLDPETSTLQDDKLALIERGLEEIAATPEGAALLQRVAAQFPDGKIPILNNEGGFTKIDLNSLDDGTEERTLVIGTEDSNFKYHSPETGEHHDLSIQRVLFHELQHLDLQHDYEPYLHNVLSREAEVVRTTNDFMTKYYGEPARDEDTSLGEFGGTQEWDFSERVNVSGQGLDGAVGLLEKGFSGATSGAPTTLPPVYRHVPPLGVDP